jgi:uncharacterized OB-fold protein
MAVGSVHRDAATTEFFDGTAAGQLLIRRCEDSGHLLAPQSRTCEGCRSDRLAWVPANGTGTVVSWSIVHGRDGSRTVVAIVELDEGPWLHTQLVDVDPDAVEGGQRVTVAFQRPDGDGGEAVPVFRP